jgi:hypothetical protein
MRERRPQPAVPLEQFITALTSQLDRAQNAMAMKAKLGYPLTFAVKDLKLELRAHVEMEGSVVKLRSAGPDDGQASTVHLELTTITRPMMEENTQILDPNDAPLDEALGDTFSEDERRRLEWAGIQTVSQLLKLEQTAPAAAIEKIANLPALRLRDALQRASQPRVDRVRLQVGQPVGPSAPDLEGGPGEVRPLPTAKPRVPGGRPAEPAVTRPPRLTDAPVLRLEGQNLVREGIAPMVTIGNTPVPVLSATPRELLVAADPQRLTGTLSVRTAPGFAYQMDLSMADDPLAGAVASATREIARVRDPGDGSDADEAGDRDGAGSPPAQTPAAVRARTVPDDGFGFLDELPEVPERRTSPAHRDAAEEVGL